MQKNRFLYVSMMLLAGGALTAYGCDVPGGDDDDFSSSAIEGDEPGECNDGADNDADGLFDCDDDNCAGAPVCQGDGDDDDAGHGDDDDGGHGDDDDGGHGDDDDGGHGDDDDGHGDDDDGGHGDDDDGGHGDDDDGGHGDDDDGGHGDDDDGGHGDDDDGGHGDDDDGGHGDDDDGGHGDDDDAGHGDDDDGASGSIVVQGFGVTWTEVTRSVGVGSASASFNAFSSWFSNQDVGWPQAGSTDTCVSGSDSSNPFLPTNLSIDVGTVSVQFNGSAAGSMTLGDYWEGSFTGWYAEGDDFDIDVTGGALIGATTWSNEIDMPDNLSASSNATVNGSDGLSVSWDSNNGPDLQIRVVNDGGGTYTWVTCTVADDGEFTISPTDLAGWPAGNAEVSVRNESPNLFTVLAGSVDGVAVGATEVTQTVNMPSF